MSGADDYILGDLLGRGAFGEVRKAEHRYLHWIVAVKLIRSSRLVKPHELLVEAEKMAALPEHDHVVPVRDAGVWDSDYVYIATELCPGGSLEEECATRALDPGTACTLIADVCTGLFHVHNQGLLHLDIRPANLLFGEDGKIKLVDFGLAKWFTDASVTNFYTPHAAPELVESGEGTRESDVWATAMTLAHLLTGGEVCRHVPFGSAAFVAACADGDWPRLDALPPNVSLRLKKPLRAATEYDVQRRPSSAKALKDLIDRATPRHSFEARSPSEWRTTDGEWTVRTSMKRSGALVEVLHRGRRLNKYRREGLGTGAAEKYAAKLMNALAYG